MSGSRRYSAHRTVNRYNRQDVLRILHITARQLSGWERSGLVDALETYSFQHLSHLRTLRDLSSRHIRSSNIQASVAAMRKVSGMANPLLESATVTTGSRVVFRHAGTMVDPISRQLMFDFENQSPRQLRSVARMGMSQRSRDAYVAELFVEAVRREDTRSGHKQVMEIYQRILELQPGHAPACINLGTLYYNLRQYPRAEEMYRRATESDPNYALAFFDLGNVLDELQRLPEAVDAYKTAIRLVPDYADAHYNLALAYQRQGEPRKALSHWVRYTRLDSVGPWANHARVQAQKALEEEHLKLVYRKR